MEELHEVQITRELAQAVFAETCARFAEAEEEVAEFNEEHADDIENDEVCHMRELDGEDWAELAVAVCGELCREHFMLDEPAYEELDDDNSRWWDWAGDAVEALDCGWEYDYDDAPTTEVSPVQATAHVVQ